MRDDDVVAGFRNQVIVECSRLSVFFIFFWKELKLQTHRPYPMQVYNQPNWIELYGLAKLKIKVVEIIIPKLHFVIS